MTTPARILYTLPNFDTAGSGRALFEVARRLDRELFAPTICVERHGGRLEAEVEAAGIPILAAPFTVPLRPLFGLAGRLRAAARPFAGEFDLWHSLHYLDDYGEPLLARAAGALFVFTKKNMSWNRRSWLLRSLFARRIAAQNSDMLRRFFGSWPLAGKTVYLPRGVDTERFAPAAPESAAVRAPGERLRVGNVAHLLPVKGQDLLIEAAARLPGVELHLAGRPLDPAFHQRLVRRIAELGIGERVFLHGEVHGVPAFLHRLDVFVLATRPRGRMEGCPVALLEAMSSGLAVCAAAIPGAGDLLADPASGILLPAGDEAFVEGLIARLGELLEHPTRRHTLGDAARRRVLQEFSIQQEVSRHERLYREMLGW